MPMKAFYLILFAGAMALSTSAQGYLGFKNRVVDSAGVIIDAPVFDVDCQTRLSGPAFLSQFYAGPTPNSLQPIAPIVPFNAGVIHGYAPYTDAMIANVPDGMIFYVQMRAWSASAGSTYESAVASGGKYGYSNIVPEAVRYAPSPVELPVGLQSFCLIPEPAPLVLFVLTILAVAAAKSVTFRRVDVRPLRGDTVK